MLTINVTSREHGEEEALKYQEQFLTEPVLKDNGREVYDLYECEGVPTTIIIDKEGQVVGHFGDQAEFVSIVHKLSEALN
ncbi:hypothetical protein [Piscibacillus salipiscarius]|nr:hypothetical protein [Piscibacillus salipiscarius]